MCHSTQKDVLNQSLIALTDPDQPAATAKCGRAVLPSSQPDQPLIGRDKKDESDSIRYTIFKNVLAVNKKELISQWSDFAAHLACPNAYPSKNAMPLVKLATFGDLRTKKNSLRHDENLEKVTGIEGDYDGELVPIEEAKRRLEAHGIRAVLYTSASHTPSAPRWRALAPLSREHLPEQRRDLVDKLNHALGGILAAESFTLSQSFYFGQIEGGQYECCITFDNPAGGNFIDLLHGLGSSRGGTSPLIASGARSLSGPTPQYRLVDAKVAGLGRLLRTGDGRREDLKSYIASKSARGFEAWEVRTLVDAFVGKYFDPSDPPDGADIDKIVDWASTRDEHRRVPASVLPAPSYPGEVPSKSAQAERAPRFDPSEGVVSVPTIHPPPREYAFAKTVTRGTVCALAGSGASFKTTMIMQACIAAAAGMMLGGLQVAEGASLLYLGEEDVAERDRRIGGICEHFNVDRRLVERRMRCFPAAGRDIRLTRTAVNGDPEETGLSDEIVEHAERLAAESGIEVTLIVVDHARLAMAGDPNNAEDVTQLTRVLASIAHRTGAAVFLLAHSPKSVISKQGSEINVADIAGSSAFADNARSAFMLYAMREDEAKGLDLKGEDRSDVVCLRNVKANYAATGSCYWFKRVYLPGWGVAVLEQIMLLPVQGSARGGKAGLLRQRILDKLISKPGGVTLRSLRGQAGKDGPLGASDMAVRAEIDRMLDDAVIVQRPPTEDERRIHRLGGQVRAVLVAA